MLINLGAAGCRWIKEDVLCCYIEKDIYGEYTCQKYGKLKKHFIYDEPWRAEACGDEADKKR